MYLSSLILLYVGTKKDHPIEEWCSATQIWGIAYVFVNCYTRIRMVSSKTPWDCHPKAKQWPRRMDGFWSNWVLSSIDNKHICEYLQPSFHTIMVKQCNGYVLLYMYKLLHSSDMKCQPVESFSLRIYEDLTICIWIKNVKQHNELD